MNIVSQGIDRYIYSPKVNIGGAFTTQNFILRRLYPSGIVEPIGHRLGSGGAGGMDSWRLAFASVCTALFKPVSIGAGLFWINSRRRKKWWNFQSLTAVSSHKINHSLLISKGVVLERVDGFEPTNGSLGSYCFTTWLLMDHLWTEITLL